MTTYLDSGAKISPCGKYRYRLWREWRLGNSTQWDMWTEDDGSPCVDGAGHQLGEPLSCLFVMLNPSTADATEDDPTIRRCVAFAKAWGYDRMDVVNLFAWRATDPKDLLAVSPAADPVGFDNQETIQEAVFEAGIVVCAWGVGGCHLDQDETVLGWIESAVSLMADEGREIPVTALKRTKEGFPSHPLYLPSHLKPQPYSGRRNWPVPR